MFVTIRFVARVALDAVVLCLFAGSLAQGQFGPQKHEPKGQWENKSLSPDERADLVIGRMTLEEKIPDKRRMFAVKGELGACPLQCLDHRDDILLIVVGLETKQRGRACGAWHGIGD
jgi:hypothetical protein